MTYTRDTTSDIISEFKAKAATLFDQHGNKAEYTDGSDLKAAWLRASAECYMAMEIAELRLALALGKETTL
jgi:hypothetical protein